MSKLKRIGAIILVCIIIGLVFLTLYCALTGSPYFTAAFLSMLFLPILLYAYMFIYRLLKGDERRDKAEKDDV